MSFLILQQVSDFRERMDGQRRESHMSAIFVSHDLAVIRCLCDRVMVMRGGELVEQGDVEHVIQEPQEEYTKKLVASVLEI